MCANQGPPGLHILYKEIGLLHRDISYGNIAFYKKDGKYYVIILDFDLAIFADRKNGATSNHRTGTAPFMSRELLNASEPPIEFTHHVTHDLESSYSVSIWSGTGYGSSFPPEDPLAAWRKGKPSEMMTAKQTFFTTDQIADKILKYITNDTVQSHLQKIRNAYKREIRAIEQEAESVDGDALEDYAHIHAQKAKDAFLRENPSFEEDSFEADQVYNEKVLQIQRSCGQGGSGAKKSPFSGISYQKIMNSIRRTIGPRHFGCRCC